MDQTETSALKTDTKVVDISNQRAKRNPAEQERFNLRLSAEQMKLALMGSMTMVVLTVTMANQSMFSGKGEADVRRLTSGRGIASVESNLGHASAADDKAFQNEIQSREMASIGQRPSDFDHLAFEVLESKYAIRLENGKIRYLEFSAPKDSTDRPKHIASGEKFLMDFKSVWAAPFNDVVVLKKARDLDRVVESYQLTGDNHNVMATAELVRDPVGRLISLRIIGHTAVASR